MVKVKGLKENFGSPQIDKYLKVLTFYYHILYQYYVLLDKEGVTPVKPENMRNTMKYQAGTG